MNTTLKERIKKHAHEVAPEECCGIVYIQDKNLLIKKCQNVTKESKNEDFEIDDTDFIDCHNKGEIIGIYHSHPESAAFSEEDIFRAEEICLPFYLYAIKEDKFAIYYPSEYLPSYIGRPFIFGVNDCYTLVREYYRREFQTGLGDYDADFDYASKEVSNFEINWEKEGFCLKTNYTDIKKGDVLVFKINKSFPQHIGVYLGKNEFLHHPLNSQSRIELLDGLWAKSLVGYLRHQNN